MSDWQPRETAPIDGEYLVYDAFYKQAAVAQPYAREGVIKWWHPVLGGRDSDTLDDVTHWMPLPDPPNAKDPPQ